MKFEAGRTYRASHISRVGFGCGEYSVTARTEKTVTIRNEVNGQTGRRKLYSNEYGEYFYPESGCKEVICQATAKQTTREEYEEAIRAAHEEKAKEEKKMTKEQKNQIMMEIKVYEIERAKTAQEIKEILMDCEKVNEMIQAYEAIMGDMYCHNTVCVSKIEIALAMTEIIWNRRENEAFEKLSLTEKVERLSTLTSEDVRQKLRWCSMDELKEIARMLEVEPSSHEIELTVRHDLEVRIYEKITHSKKLKKILSNAKGHENA